MRGADREDVPVSVGWVVRYSGDSAQRRALWIHGIPAVQSSSTLRFGGPDWPEAPMA